MPSTKRAAPTVDPDAVKYARIQTAANNRISIYFSYILPYRFNSFTRSLKVATLLILEGKRLAREFASSD